MATQEIAIGCGIGVIHFFGILCRSPETLAPRPLTVAIVRGIGVTHFFGIMIPKPRNSGPTAAISSDQQRHGKLKIDLTWLGVATR